MTSPSLSRSLRLAQLALAFGRVERITRHEDGLRPETDTDHTVMLGLVACELAPPHLDRGRIAAFALVHDLPEVYAGDTPTLVISPEAVAAKSAREDAARSRLTAELGDESWLARLLAIYEWQMEPEARFVRLIDKVLPKLTHAFNGCVAALPITDRSGFVDAHAKQLQKLREEYPEFPDAHELLRASMLRAEECWPAALDGGAPMAPQPGIDLADRPHQDAATLAFDAIAIACGCAQWDYPGQLVRDVKALAERATAHGNLLAVIHRDGGHHVGRVGWAQAATDAERIVVEMREENARLRATALVLYSVAMEPDNGVTIDEYTAAVDHVAELRAGR